MENSVRSAMRAAKNAVMQFSEIEVKIRDVTSNDPWGPSTTLLAEVARATNNYEDYPKLFHRLWQRLNDTEHVMHVQKSLMVVDYLLRNGAERFINDCKRRARDIAQLKKYKHYDSNNQDDAKECRARAKLVYDLLMDDAKIAEERSKASRIRDVRLQGFGSGLSDFHVGNANEISSPNPVGYGGGGKRGGDGYDDDRSAPYKKPESFHDDDGKGDANGGDEDGEKKKKKKKKKEKKEEDEEVAAEGGEGGEGEKKKKKKKKKKPEEEETDAPAPRKPSFTTISSSSAFPSTPSSRDPFASSSSSDPFGSAPSAASAYAAVVSSSAAPSASDDIFSKLSVGHDLSAHHHRPNGEIDFVTGGGNGASGEDLSNLFSSSLTVSGNESNLFSSSPHRSPMTEPALQVFGQKRSDLWESDLLNIDNIKDEDAAKKKSSQLKEQQMTMGMMRSIQPLGSAPPKQNNSHRKSGIAPNTVTPSAGPVSVQMGGGMGYGVSSMGMAPVNNMAMSGMVGMGGMNPMMQQMGGGMAPMTNMGGMGMGGGMGMNMGGMVGGMNMGGMGGMVMVPMGGGMGMGMGGGMGGMGRSAPGPNSATNDVFFK